MNINTSSSVDIEMPSRQMQTEGNSLVTGSSPSTRKRCRNACSSCTADTVKKVAASVLFVVLDLALIGYGGYGFYNASLPDNSTASRFAYIATGLIGVGGGIAVGVGSLCFLWAKDRSVEQI